MHNLSNLVKLVEKQMEMSTLETTYGVLDDGFVRLEDHMGGDLSVVNHARISLAKRSDELDQSDEQLIGYLMRNRHGTPFESVHFSFHIRAPIFVARQWMRHRMASYNEISGRYTEAKEKFYTPKGPFIRGQVGKRGDYSFEEITDEGAQEDIIYAFELHYQECMNRYNWLREKGVARELARIVLPSSLYTEFYFDVNARSLMNFISQRNHSHAQMEMKMYAENIERFFAAVAPMCYNAFIENGRTAP
jgi:thymidylate synthase (FAD)